MSDQRTYVYRLHVEYPEGVDADNPPEAWDPGPWNPDPEADDSFHWPQVTQYLSRSGAKRRADLLVKYGCKVGIERSKLVEWETV